MQTVDCPKAALFDLDDTLAESFESPSEEIIGKLLKLLDFIPVAIITGRDLQWMAADFLAKFASSPHFERFFVLPEGSAQCLQWNGNIWEELYGQTLTLEELGYISKTIMQSARETEVMAGLPVYGKQLVEKSAMVAFAMLGVGVPRDLKYSWDPGNIKRLKLRDDLAKRLPDYEVVLGGATSVDVTKKGVNKSYGVRFLAKHLGIASQDMMYVGDALYPGGNDHVVIETGIKTRSTSGPEETSRIIDELIPALSI